MHHCNIETGFQDLLQIKTQFIPCWHTQALVTLPGRTQAEKSGSVPSDGTLQIRDGTWSYSMVRDGTWWVLHTTLSYVVLWCLQVHRATWDSKNLMVLEATPWYLMVFDEYFIPRCPMFSYVFLCHATMPFKWHSLGPWYKRMDAHLPHPFDQIFCAPHFLVNLGGT